MQRPSWSSLKEKWGNLFFFDGLSLFISRLYEEKGKAIAGVVLFDPLGKSLPPKAPPVYITVIYKNSVDLLKENLRLRTLDPEGIIEPICYGIDTVKEMFKRGNPIIYQMILNGIVVYELNAALEEIDTLL